jgi:hypothetical protein
VISITNKLNVTFGTLEFLQSYINSYPEYEFKLLKSSTSDDEDDRYQLLDVTNDSSIFKYGKSYNIVDSVGSNEFRGFFRFTFFKLSTEQIKIFTSLTKLHIFNAKPHPFLRALLLIDADNPDEYVLLTLWATQRDFDEWQKTNDYQSIYSTLANPIYPSYSKNYYLVPMQKKEFH